MTFREQITEQIVAMSEPIPNKIMLTGSTVSLIGGLSTTTIIAVLGFIVTVIGLIWQRIEAYHQTQREVREHTLRMELLHNQIEESKTRTKLLVEDHGS